MVGTCSASIISPMKLCRLHTVIIMKQPLANTFILEVQVCLARVCWPGSRRPLPSPEVDPQVDLPGFRGSCNDYMLTHASALRGTRSV
jgi:hypothetical protein